MQFPGRLQVQSTVCSARAAESFSFRFLCINNIPDFLQLNKRLFKVFWRHLPEFGNRIINKFDY